MNKTSQITASSRVADHLIEPEAIDPAATLPLADHADETEIQSNNDEKLATLRHAIEMGNYDSDAILEKALHRMLKVLEESKNEQ